MNVKAVNMPTPAKRSSYTNPAKRGAAITAGMLTASTAITWAVRPDEMRSVVKSCGGKNKYLANYAIGLALFAGAGAIINTAFSVVANKINPKKTPKAVN